MSIRGQWHTEACWVMLSQATLGMGGAHNRNLVTWWWLLLRGEEGTGLGKGGLCVWVVHLAAQWESQGHGVSKDSRAWGLYGLGYPCLEDVRYSFMGNIKQAGCKWLQICLFGWSLKQLVWTDLSLALGRLLSQN